jgi:hypothetical protein
MDKQKFANILYHEASEFSPKLSDTHLYDVFGKKCPKFKGKHLSENFSAEIKFRKIGP